jgi:outer membrane protein OmpA-like peptidoglycan-associated protein
MLRFPLRLLFIIRIITRRACQRRRGPVWGCAVSAALAAGSLAISHDAAAQQQTFHLDRLEVPGAPNDGVVLFRPELEKTSDPIVYGQLGIGFALDPLRTGNITNDSATLRDSAGNVITTQLSTYMSAGVHLFERLSFGATFPVAWIETGNQPNVPNSFGSTAAYTNFSTTGPAVGDLRLDARYTAWRSEDMTQTFGAQLSVWLPTGTSTNFGGDGPNLAAMPMVTYEWTPPHFVTLVGNLGIDFRSQHSVNDPAGHLGPPNGLGVGTELRWALGAFLPLAGEKFRVGATIFGQTGLTDSDITGPTIFTGQNTPIELVLEGRMKYPEIGWDNFYVGASAGRSLLDGYGAPDLRLVVLAGTFWPIQGTSARSPESREKMREGIRESLKDTDGDGIPDEIDACPTEPEDHKEPDPSDGCPAPIDSDNDGIPDAVDACPREPGAPDPDPKKNGCPQFISLEGSTVRVLQQVHFATGSAAILEDSFPMLTEIADLLKANPGIQKMRIEGHTDNRGAADMNLDLSKRRAASVRTWLIEHGVASERLESEGYGLTRPIQTNDTDEGRAANRRVDFKIAAEVTPAGPAK